MALFKLNGSKLIPVKETGFDSQFKKEKELQNFTENNLQELFGLDFIATEFKIESFWLDSLAFDPTRNSFVIIEYKKAENFSLMDQGQTYLNLVSENKAEVLLKFNKKTGKILDKNDIDWSQLRVMFIGPKFNIYQKRALSQSLPFELWKVTIYEDGLIEYDEIIPVGLEKGSGKKIASVLTGPAAKEIKVYSERDLVKPTWIKARELLREFESALMSSEIETRVKYNKQYIAYISKHARNYVEIVPQNKGLKVYFRFPYNYINSSVEISDCSKVGRFANGDSVAFLKEITQIAEFVRLSIESFYFLHKDIYKDHKV